MRCTGNSWIRNGPELRKCTNQTNRAASASATRNKQQIPRAYTKKLSRIRITGTGTQGARSRFSRNFQLGKVAPERLYQKKNVGEDQNHIVRYAAKVSNNNLDFLTTIEGENGIWTLDRQSKGVGFDGNRAYGLCQFYYTFHKDFINSEDFKDYKKQVDKCWELWSEKPTRFQAYHTRKRHYNKFYLN